MGCRVGMSKYPYKRIEEWKEEEGHTGGEVLATGLTYDEATQLERDEALKRGCCQSEGGPRDSNSNWAVYHVWGGNC